MANAKDEFLDHIEARSVKCAEIGSGRDYTEAGLEWEKTFLLSAGYGDNELKLFLQLLDFRYDDGYGGQELFGTIWYQDGTWSSRGEYDGSEWWEHNVCPPIPEYLQGEPA